MMPRIFGFFILLLFSFNVWAIRIQTGDILLQPLHCYLCSLIEAETNSPFSHMGVAVTDGEEVYVLEAYQNVSLVPLSEFLKKTQASEKVKVMRYRGASFEEHDFDSFIRKTLGHPYNSSYVFNSYKENKRAYYCSELVYEAYISLGFKMMDLKVMPFKVNPDLWDRHFQGKTPRGELGISPTDFEDEAFFYLIGEL